MQTTGKVFRTSNQMPGAIFLAGSVGPLALVWVVLSFFLQGNELRNSIKSLDMQTEELKQSVRAQSDLAKSSSEQIEFQARTRDADLWLEIRKAELDVRNNLLMIDRLLPVVKRSRMGALAARGMANSGAREQFESDLLKIKEGVNQIDAPLNSKFPVSLSEISIESVHHAALIYDLNANSSFLVGQLNEYLEEDKVEADRRYQEAHQKRPHNS
ncbi:hypothetical protein SLH49_06560 [Cognatiyoonia sp. IB215446]|uniref:hypothetical protein n=1 Tax=Cognatiyoonia sp. IB215446 TaxID=3097355 RepID=UPI002A13F8CF|nr:hypothetical protein [Cognatiyoonia sp. IB215446]MDX8347644.1 hypothetical protein [Cognatiyoonia sp. IB215446]